MYLIGITGGIGSGKSTVTEFIRNKKIKVVDADEISREITKDGSHTINQLVTIFGEEILKEPGVLDRKKLAKLVFNDLDMKKKLDDFMLIRIISEINRQLMLLSNEGLVFLDAPLLYEAELDKICEEVWTVSAPLEVRIARVMKRDGVSKEEVKERINNQMPDEEKNKLADVVLDNSSDKIKLEQDIETKLKEVEGRIDVYEEESDEEINNRVSGDPFLDML